MDRAIQQHDRSIVSAGKAFLMMLDSIDAMDSAIASINFRRKIIMFGVIICAIIAAVGSFF
jgi:hypothetical protein